MDILGTPPEEHSFPLPTALHVDRRLDVTWRLSRRDVVAGETLKGIVTVRNVAEESLDVAYSKVSAGVTRPGHDAYLGVVADLAPGVVRRSRIAPGERVEIDAVVGTAPVGNLHLEPGDYVAVGALYLGIGSSRSKAVYVLRAPLVLHSASQGVFGAFA